MASGDTSPFADIKNLLADMDYCDIKPLGKGSFGEVLSAISPNKKRVAVKIIKNKDAWHIEESVWPVLCHRNILPLLERINVDNMNLKLYVMPRHPYALNRILRSKRFLADENGFEKIKRWFADILDGLKYLHDKGWAHTDIKSDNILIAADGRGVLCDFSGLTHAGEPLKRLCAPLAYRPPEYYDPARHENLEGAACDVWLFGMMCLNVLTGNWPKNRMKFVTDANSWKMNVEPVVLQALEKTTFCTWMKSAFPAVPLTEDELHLAHNFVVSIMKWNPQDRPPAQKIRSHPFLSNLSEIKEKVLKKSLTKDQRNVVTNPFLEGWKTSKIEIKKDCVQKKQITECAEKNTNSYYAEKVVIFEQNNLMPVFEEPKERKNYLTNPFVKKDSDFETENKICNNQEPKVNSLENVTNPFLKECISSKKTNEIVIRQLPKIAENMEMVKNDIVSSESQRSNYVPDYPEARKNIPDRIKDWLKKKWNKTFQKPNKYKKLKEESE